MTEQKNTPHQEVQGKQKLSNAHSNENRAQAQRIFDYLSVHHRATTIELRAKLDILHPAGRIKDLRRDGRGIETIYEQHPTECGKLHRVGVYVLISQPKG